jgi:NitT/TauT family transport system permease protein
MKYNIVTISIIILFWEFVLKGGFIPGLWEIVNTFFTLLITPDFLINLKISLYRLGIGWFLGMILGTSIGIFMGVFEPIRRLLMPVVSCLFPIPKIALLPLFIVLLGLGEVSKILTIFIGGFFPSIITAYSAVLRTPKELIDTGRAYNNSRWQIIKKIIIPYNLPTIIQGFRTSTSLSLTLLVAAEMLGATHGIGNWIFVTGGDMQFAEMFAGIIWLSIIGLSINWAVNYLKHALCYWSTLSEGAK